ncbi:MAG: Maf family protein [Nitrospirales bacterium]
MSIVLASTSPRRQDLLGLLGLSFDVVAPRYVEAPRVAHLPADQVLAFALGKAWSCAPAVPDRLVLGSDTVIEVEGTVLGKPSGRGDAERMLHRLAGRTHLIHTAVALVRGGDGMEQSGLETVRVWMKPLSRSAIRAYVRSGEGLGKAGSYAIQGAGGALIDRIEGDYTAAVGLPLRLVARMLTAQGVVVPVDVEALYRTRPYPNWQAFPS